MLDGVCSLHTLIWVCTPHIYRILCCPHIKELWAETWSLRKHYGMHHRQIKNNCDGNFNHCTKGMVFILNTLYTPTLWFYSEVAAAADACTHHILPVGTQVTSLWHALCTEKFLTEHKMPTLPIEPSDRQNNLNKQPSNYRLFALKVVFLLSRLHLTIYVLTRLFGSILWITKKSGAVLSKYRVI